MTLNGIPPKTLDLFIKLGLSDEVIHQIFECESQCVFNDKWVMGYGKDTIRDVMIPRVTAHVSLSLFRRYGVEGKAISFNFGISTEIVVLFMNYSDLEYNFKTFRKLLLKVIN